MESSPLDGIFKECPRFRILTSGKSGVGKTTLIKRTFNIDKIEASDKDPGKCDIEDEIYSSQNERFVLHDSQGFEPAETENFNKVKNFIESRARMPAVKDQLHAVWLCTRIPQAGGRLIEIGDEEFLKLPFRDLPIVVVLTQYDSLYKTIRYNLARSGKLNNMDATQQKLQIENESNRYFEENCVQQLEKLSNRPKRLKWVKVSAAPEYRDTLVELVQVTEELVRNHVAESVWIASATAQRVNADENVKSSICVGMKKYWRGLAVGTFFAKRRLDACINVINRDIINIWNFRDDDKILDRPSFKNAVLLFIQDLADPSSPGADSGITKDLGSIKAALDVATPISGPLAPVVASVGLSVMLVNKLTDMYRSTPGVLRCLMGYIVDVTIVLEVLFWLKVAQPHQPSLCDEDIIAAFGLYQGSPEQNEVHQQIRAYVDGMTFLEQVKPEDNTHLEIERLINSHRRILIDSIFSEAKKGPS